MYTADDFNTENAPKEMVQYIIDNIENFDERYGLAHDFIGKYRCPLIMAGRNLYFEISDRKDEWCRHNGLDPDDYDIEEIFG